MSSIENIYQEDIDFAQLALQDAEFAKVLKSNGQLDFSNPESVLQLTKSLLKRDFGLQISLPSDRLCPPVPNRLNYILWIQALLDSTSDSYTDVYDPSREVLGLDIGTGASCIYPLLGCSQRPKWRFGGTDVDERSLEFARKNVKGNDLAQRIKLLKTSPNGPLISLDAFGFESADFSMCNPPFYESGADMLQSAESKQRPPNTACTGSAGEMVTPGGEVAFITRMIDESLVLKDRVQWYTSMCGKLSSVSTLLAILRSKKIDNYAVTEFVQGSKTRRWGIAWSFDDFRPPGTIARHLHSLPKQLLPFPPEYCISLPAGANLEKASRVVNKTLSALPLKWMWRSTIAAGLGFTDRNVWSRAARRQSRDQNTSDKMDDDELEMSLGFKIQIVEEKSANKLEPKVIIRWLKGNDAVLFESFCGMLKRKFK
ncbi:hypothetical protein PVAG01_00717 [Phlyctema vagabunda]|uniref:U6 small nuclear RNA (adenine-(43)-N(6))-methyltransferase n=1 Tax=Phlyctema vagabunda TaxID=108571 RepID=A0ABR4PVH5_9HELO